MMTNFAGVYRILKSLSMNWLLDNQTSKRLHLVYGGFSPKYSEELLYSLECSPNFLKNILYYF